MTAIDARGRRVVLIADPEAPLRRLLVKALGDAGVELATCESAASALSLLRGSRVDVAYVDQRILREGGDALGAALAEIEVVVGAPRGEALATRELPACVRAVVERPGGSVDAAVFALERALELHALKREASRAALREPSFDAEMIAATKATRALVSRARRVAPSVSPVLVLGEPGTGKETLARLIHRVSQRGALVSLDAAELSPMELERELGVGAPSPSAAPNAWQRAEGATLLLLHVDRLAASLQKAVLARMSAANRPRLLATASPSIREAQRSGAFDPALFLALATTLLEIPPLRQRRDEIPVLASHFLQEELARRDVRRELTIGPSAMRALRRAPLPLNVAELKAAVTHAALVARTATIVPGDLPDEEGTQRTLRAGLGEEPYAEARRHALAEFERAYVDEILARTGQNLAQAAREAGMDRANFRRLVKRTRGKDRS